MKLNYDYFEFNYSKEASCMSSDSPARARRSLDTKQDLFLLIKSIGFNFENAKSLIATVFESDYKHILECEPKFQQHIHELISEHKATFLYIKRSEIKYEDLIALYQYYCLFDLFHFYQYFDRHINIEQYQ